MKDIIPLEKLKSGSTVELDASLFEPVGEWKKEKNKVEIIVNSGKDTAFDHEIFLSLLPASPNELYHLVKKAFEQYYSDQWCGQEGINDVLDTFDSSMDLYKANPREKFKNEGLAPFFEIHRIEVDLEALRVIISGSADEDVNLDEHGVDILLQDGEVVFGYALDHETASDHITAVCDLNANFIKTAFPKVNCEITPFVGFWDVGFGSTLEISKDRILFHSAFQKDKEPSRLVVKMCSSNHLCLTKEDGFLDGDVSQDLFIKLDGHQLELLNFDGTQLASLKSKTKR